jgi:anthranilate phosphoribosyltransferase
LTGPTKIITSSMEGAKSSGFWRKSLVTKWNPRGQTIEESAQMFTNIISGNGTEAQNNVVCANGNGHRNDNEMYTARRIPNS